MLHERGKSADATLRRRETSSYTSAIFQVLQFSIAEGFYVAAWISLLLTFVFIHCVSHRFDSTEAVYAATRKALNSIPETDLQRTFDEWQTRRTKCIGAGGKYFEDD